MWLIRKVRNNKNNIILLVLISLIVSAVKNFNTVTETRASATAKTTVTAEEIRRILELNGASQKVTIETDTGYVSVSIPSIIGINLPFLEKEIPHRLWETRTYLIKAGTDDFDLEETESGYQLQLRIPKITGREHQAEQYTIKKRVGVWNPVTLKHLEIRSRDRATERAIADGILKEARYSIENALYGILPNNVEIAWKQ